MMRKETVSKLIAAQRQLSTAVDLYFGGRDLVSAWTLGAAAYNVLRDLKVHAGGPSMMLKDQLVQSMKGIMRDRLRARIQEVENFCKHADRDPEGTLDFNPIGKIELLLFDAATAYRELAGHETASMAMIRMWFLSNAQIEYESCYSLDTWLASIRPLPSELRSDYCRRLWHEAVRVSDDHAPLSL